MISHDQISITYRGQITRDIYQFKFLEFDNLEVILFQKQKETAVSLSQAKTIIVNFQNVPKKNYTLFNLYEGMKILFDMNIIKDLQEVQFKFFSNEQLQVLIKLKWLKSENTNQFYFEIQEKNQYELSLQWRDSIQVVECIKKELEKQFLKKNLIKILNKIGDYSNIYDQQELFNIILDNHYDSLYVYFHSIIKLTISTKKFEENKEQIRSIELFIHNQIKESQDKFIDQFEILHTQIQRSMKYSNDEIIFDYALIYYEDQLNCSELMSKFIYLIITILLTNKKKIKSIVLNLVPLEIRFELNINKQELNLDINLHHQDPQDMYYEGLKILLQTISTYQLFQSLKVNIQYDDIESNNIKFLLFPFVMMIHEFQQALKYKGTLTYNNYQLIPSYHSEQQKIYQISEKTSTYEITMRNCLEIEEEIESFVQYINFYALESNSIIIYCDLFELNKLSKQSFDSLINLIIQQDRLLGFRIINEGNRDERFYGRVIQQLLLPLIKYFRLKKRMLSTLLRIEKRCKGKMRLEIIKEVINYLPNEYECLLHLQN